MAEFEVDEHIAQFEQDVGLNITAVANLLQSQADEIKERNWSKFSKGKDELVSFVEIYTVVFGLIALTLKAKQLSNKPSKNSIKALTIKLLPKLATDSEQQPVLTKLCFTSNLHTLLHEIHAEVQELQKTSNEETGGNDEMIASKKTTFLMPPNVDEQIDRVFSTDLAHAGLDTLDVGDICRVHVEFEYNGINYYNKVCSIAGEYDADSDAYLVKFRDDNEKTTIMMMAAANLEYLPPYAHPDLYGVVQIEQTRSIDPVYVGLDTLTVGDICRCIEFEDDDGVNLDGELCVIDGEYQSDTKTYCVTLKESAQRKTVPAAKLEYLPPVAHPELYAKSTSSNNNEVAEELQAVQITDCMKAARQQCVEIGSEIIEYHIIDGWQLVSCRVCCMIVCLVIASFIIDWSRRPAMTAEGTVWTWIASVLIVLSICCGCYNCCLLPIIMCYARIAVHFNLCDEE